MGIKRHLNKLWTYLYIDTHASEVVILAGSGRSGSTWLQNVITCEPRWRIMFEPFWYEGNRMLSNWSGRQYITEENGEKYFDQVEMIINGKVRNSWIDQDNRSPFPKKRFIKDIRINLFLKWLKGEFSHVKLIFLLRNPYAVASSRMNLGWDVSIDVFTSQKLLVNDHLKLHLEFINTVSDRYCLHFLMWVIENYVALRTLESRDCLVVYYENLKNEPLVEVDRIFKHLCHSTPKAVYKKIDNPSRTSSKNNGSNVIGLTKEQLKMCTKILKEFGMEGLYEDPFSPPTIHADEIISTFARCG
jgi:hypothetical protein